MQVATGVSRRESRATRNRLYRALVNQLTARNRLANPSDELVRLKRNRKVMGQRTA